VNIEQFYDANPARRESSEVEFGRDWHDAAGVRFEVSWVKDTGELYVLVEPVPKEWATPFGGVHVHKTHRVDEKEVEEMSVNVIGTISDQGSLEAALSGWQDVMSAPDSITWLVDRLRGAGIVSPAQN
jgi:hypothetical protein